MSFFGSGWKYYGTKSSLARQLTAITRIDKRILLQADLLSGACLAKRLSWAARRTTTRVEDRAYCLLGILGVNMALLYGEGENAFVRLQEEFIKMSTDHSVLLWHYLFPDQWKDTLAFGPGHFEAAGRITEWIWHPPKPFELTSVGLRMTVPALDVDNQSYAILNCRYENDFQGPIALPISILNETGPGEEKIISVARDPVSRTARYPTIALRHLDDAVQQPLLIPSQRLRDESFAAIASAERISILTKFDASFLEESSLVKAGPKEVWNPHTRVMEWSDDDLVNSSGHGWLIWRIPPHEGFFILLIVVRRVNSIFVNVESPIFKTAELPSDSDLLRIRPSYFHFGPAIQYSTYRSITAMKLSESKRPFRCTTGQSELIDVSLDGLTIMGAGLCCVQLSYIVGEDADRRVSALTVPESFYCHDIARVLEAPRSLS